MMVFPPKRFINMHSIGLQETGALILFKVNYCVTLMNGYRAIQKPLT